MTNIDLEEPQVGQITSDKQPSAVPNVATVDTYQQSISLPILPFPSTQSSVKLVPPLHTFYEMFLRREEERRRDKETFEAALTHHRKQREIDRKRIACLEEMLRVSPAAHLNGNGNGHKCSTNGTAGALSYRRVSLPKPGDLPITTTASFPSGRIVKQSEISDHPLPTSHAPTHPLPAPLPHLPHPPTIGIMPSMEQKGKANARQRPQACEVAQPTEDEKVPNVEELEIEQFFA